MTINSDSNRFLRAILVTAVLLLLHVFQLFHVVKWSDQSYEVIEQTTKCENQVIVLQNQVRGYRVKPSLLTEMIDLARAIRYFWLDQNHLIRSRISFSSPFSVPRL